MTFIVSPALALPTAACMLEWSPGTVSVAAATGEAANNSVNNNSVNKNIAVFAASCTLPNTPYIKQVGPETLPHKNILVIAHFKVVNCNYHSKVNNRLAGSDENLVRPLLFIAYFSPHSLFLLPNYVKGGKK